jgi:hypothetical protein
MGRLLIPVSIVLAASVAVIFPGLISRSRLAALANRFKLRGLTYCSKLTELVSRVTCQAQGFDWPIQIPKLIQ